MHNFLNKINKMKPNFTTCCILICIFSNLSFANYTGTPKTPNLVEGCYSIGSAEELYGFAELVNDTTSSFTQDSKTCVKLTADIVVNEKVLIGNSLNNSDSLIPWTPINVFYGTFDGQNHSISGLYLVRTGALNEAGFFLNLTGLSESKPAVVKNLKIKDSYFEGEACVGAIAGQARDVQIENSATEAAIIAKKKRSRRFYRSCSPKPIHKEFLQHQHNKNLLQRRRSYWFVSFRDSRNFKQLQCRRCD